MKQYILEGAMENEQLENLKDEVVKELDWKDWREFAGYHKLQARVEYTYNLIIAKALSSQNKTIEELRATITNSDTYKELMSVILERDNLKEENERLVSREEILTGAYENALNRIEEKDKEITWWHARKEAYDAEIDSLKKQING